jgi:hypothetical protein
MALPENIVATVGEDQRVTRAGRWLPIIALLVSLVDGSCTYLPTRITFFSKPADHVAQENDIWEAVFQYRIDSMGSDFPFFLSIDGKDPSDSFMARFASSRAHVKKDSGSYYAKEPSPGSLRDRSTGEKAVSLSAGPVTWISSDRVELRGGMYCGVLCADAGIYSLAKRNGLWTVEQYEARMHA